jgi:uncharacterized membrane protein YdjX (TVP38/TMEM64 family)
VFLFIALVLGLTVLATALGSHIVLLCEWVRDLGWSGKLFWFIFMTLWIVCCLPTTIPEMACGFMFGLWVGLAVAIPAKLCGASCSFILGRYMVGEKVERRIWANYKYTRALKAVVSERPWVVCILLRVAYIPNAIKNYGLSTISCVQFKHFIGSDCLTTGAFAFVFVNAGQGAADIFGASATDTEEEGAATNTEVDDEPVGNSTESIVITVIGAVSLIALMVVIGVKAKAKVHGMLTVADVEAAENDLRLAANLEVEELGDHGTTEGINNNGGRDVEVKVVEAIELELPFRQEAREPQETTLSTCLHLARVTQANI